LIRLAEGALGAVFKPLLDALMMIKMFTLELNT